MNSVNTIPANLNGNSLAEVGRATIATIVAARAPTITGTIAITLDDDMIELFRRLTAHTGTSASDAIRKLISAHFGDLCEVDTFLEQLPKNSPIWNRAKHLLDNFAPDSLIDDMKELDPTYRTMEDRFRDELHKATDGTA